MAWCFPLFEPLRSALGLAEVRRRPWAENALPGGVGEGSGGGQDGSRAEALGEFVLVNLVC